MARILIFSIVLIACYFCAQASMQQIDSSSDSIEKVKNKLFSIRERRDSCGRHGDPCVVDKDCCNEIKCHRYAKQCQVQIKPEELMAQREKLVGKLG